MVDRSAQLDIGQRVYVDSLDRELFDGRRGVVEGITPKGHLYVKLDGDSHCHAFFTRTELVTE